MAAVPSEYGRGDRVVGRSLASRGPVIARRGMVTSTNALATQIGLDVLRRGGSAVDAAIAVNAALGVVMPVGGGIGGDLFAIVWDPKSRRLHGLNASGRSPAALSADGLRERLAGRTEIPLWGALGVTVPGAVDGWFTLHERFGRMKMRELLAPAISLARDGHAVAGDVAFYLDICYRRYLADIGAIEEFDNFRETFAPSGSTAKVAEIFRNPDLAATYELIARRGVNAFYRGPIAETIDRYMRRIGGYLRKEDLAAHRSEWVAPIGVSYRGHDVFTLPPNSQGLAALQMLNVLESLGPHADRTADGAAHLLIESKKLAFGDRAQWIADPAFGAIPVAELLSTQRAAEFARKIDPDHAADGVAPWPHADADTVYMAVADSDGMIVSLIQSNFQGMGSGLVPDGLGFVLHDRGAQFDARPGRANSYAPGKRPFHTLMPAFVLRAGRPFLAIGVIGGDMQPQALVQILRNRIGLGMNIQEAGDAARLFHTGDVEPIGRGAGSAGIVHAERGVPADVLAGLRRRGHEVRAGERVFGAFQAIEMDPVSGAYWGASDGRMDGQAAGY